MIFYSVCSCFTENKSDKISYLLKTDFFLPWIAGKKKAPEYGAFFFIVENYFFLFCMCFP